ncbi:MAG TPA: sulfurtransferase [Mycobacteriales bacterium]|nr:sulfurtransferase [Mycobacteriales bacterium]
MTGPLMTTAELAALIDAEAAVTVLDVRWRLMGPPAYDDHVSGRIPGAAFVDLARDLAAPPGVGGRHPLPARGDFEAAMRRSGVSNDVPVVVYDDADGTSAARAWWLLRHHGHPDVRLLDGGWRAWLAEGRPTESGQPAPAVEGDFRVGDGVLPVLDVAGAAALARDGVLLDARAAERYRGEVEPIDPVAGHIPGAVSAPTTASVTSDGRFHDPAALREKFAALGIGRGTDVGVYCGSGVTAAHEVLALELAGIRGALYPGSWSEWVRDPSRPVATGDGAQSSP